MGCDRRRPWPDEAAKPWPLASTLSTLPPSPPPLRHPHPFRGPEHQGHLPRHHRQEWHFTRRAGHRIWHQLVSLFPFFYIAPTPQKLHSVLDLNVTSFFFFSFLLALILCGYINVIGLFLTYSYDFFRSGLYIYNACFLVFVSMWVMPI